MFVVYDDKLCSFKERGTFNHIQKMILDPQCHLSTRCHFLLLWTELKYSLSFVADARIV